MQHNADISTQLEQGRAELLQFHGTAPQHHWKLACCVLLVLLVMTMWRARTNNDAVATCSAGDEIGGGGGGGGGGSGSSRLWQRTMPSISPMRMLQGLLLLLLFMFGWREERRLRQRA